MKIAFLSYAYGQLEYGAGRYAWHLTEELKKMGHTVDVFTPDVHLSKTGPILFSFKNIFRKIKKYDIVHSNEAAGLFLSHPVIVETYHHDYSKVPEFGHRFFNILETIQCHKVKHIIVPSYSSQTSLLDHGFSVGKISVIHHGVDQIFKENIFLRKKTRSELGLSNKFVIINVGRLVKHKRQVDLIKALKDIPNVVLILVGTGYEENNIHDVASKVGVKLLHFRAVSDDFLVELYNASDLYVHASSLEGFGLTILEAMACGLPILAYKSGDFDKIVGNAGCLFDTDIVAGLNENLQTLIDDVAMRTEMKNAALTRTKYFSWSETAKKHIDVYKFALDFALNGGSDLLL
jgi:glycosyltransferase involved in cell wall biosynthesis